MNEEAKKLAEFIREELDKKKASDILVLDVAEKICDQVAIIKQGKLVVFGKMEEVKGMQSLENVFLELENDKHD